MRRQWDGDSKNESVSTNHSTQSTFFEKVLGLFGFEAEEVVEEPEVAAVQEESLKRELRDRSKVVSLTNANKSIKMIVMEPVSFEEVQTIVDYLKNKQTVILNLEETDKSVARRIADFLGGAIYALDGSMQKVSGSIILFTPPNVEVTLPIRPVIQEEGLEHPFPASLSSAIFKKDRDLRRK